MVVLHVLERAKEMAGVFAMVWTASDDDPRLIEARHFKGDAALKVWLAGIGARHCRENIRVSWTETLRSDDRLSAMLRDSVGAVTPLP